MSAQLVQRLQDASALVAKNGITRRRQSIANLLAEAADEIERLHEALRRAREWGGLGTSYSASVRYDLVQWVDDGMGGPLPPMPAHLTEVRG